MLNRPRDFQEEERPAKVQKITEEQEGIRVVKDPMEEMNEIVNGKIPLDTIDPAVLHDDEASLLHYACEQGNLELFRILIQHPLAHPNLINFDGETLLHWACLGGNAHIVQELLKKKADPTIADGNGTTPLHWAIKQQNLPIVKLLLEDNRTDPNYCEIEQLPSDHDQNSRYADYESASPLMLACTTGNADIVKMLTEHPKHSFDLPIHKLKGFGGPFHAASFGENADIVRILLSYKKFREWDNFPEFGSVLHFACAQSNLEVIDMLYENFKNDKPDYSEEEEVRICDDLRFVLILWNKQSLLHTACEHGHLEVVKHLVKLGEYPMETDYLEETALMFAAQENNLELVKYLMEIPGVDITQNSEYDTNLLTHALRGENCEIVKYLLQQEIDLTVDACALSYITPEATRLLLECPGVEFTLNEGDDTPLHWMCKRGDVFGVRKLLGDPLTDPNAKNYLNQRPLHLSCNEDVLRLMLQDSRVETVFTISLINSSSITKLIQDGSLLLMSNANVIMTFLEEAENLTVTEHEAAQRLQHEVNRCSFKGTREERDLWVIKLGCKLCEMTQCSPSDLLPDKYKEFRDKMISYFSQSRQKSARA